MADVVTEVLWQISLDGDVFRAILSKGHANDAAGYTGSYSIEKLVTRPDNTTFWHALAGEAFNPNDAGTNPLGPLYGSWEELLNAYPRVVMPETFKTKADVDTFIEDWRKRQVDRYLDRASETYGKYWNPVRAALARERTKSVRDRLVVLLAEIEELLK